MTIHRILEWRVPPWDATQLGEETTGGYVPYSHGACFDLGHFHNAPTCDVSPVPGSGGMGVKLYCGPCRVLADVEACGIRITAESAANPRRAP